MTKKEYVKNKRGDIIYPVTKEDLVFDDNGIALSEKLAELSQTANSAYQKPDSGIPASDIAVGVIPDVSNFITASVNNLINYYLKSETYTKAEVNALIRSIQGFSYESVESLPTASANTMGIIYLIPSEDPQTKNVKDEYITLLSGEVGSYTYSWEQIGSTAIDLSGYVTTEALNTELAKYTTTANLTTLLATKQDTISDLATIRSGAAAGATAYQKPAGGIPKSDTASDVQISLGKADTAYQKPSGGVPKTDLDSGVQASLDLADSAVQAEPIGSIVPPVNPSEFATKEEVNQLGQEVNGGGYAVITTVQGSSLSSCGGTIRSSDNTWIAQNDYYGALIPVTNHRGMGCIIKKNTNDNHIDYAFLIAGFSAGKAARFATGYSAVVRSESDVRTTVPSDAVYLYVYMVSTGVVYTPSEVQIINTSTEVVGLSTRVDNIEEVDSLQSRFLRCLAPKKLRLCTYNIGHFSGGVSKNSSITSSDYDAKLLLYKDTIRQTSADIIGICEYSKIFGTNPDNEQVLAEDVLLQSFIPSLIGSQYNYSCNALFSKTIVENPQKEDYQCNQTAVITHTTLIEAKDYYYIEADLYMHGEPVKLVITHLAFDNNRPGVLQGDQINELITKYSTFDKVIMMGDWNVANFSEFDAFTNAGYSLANDGTFLTYPSGGRALDNIIVKGLTISNPGMITTQGQSDHYPFYCDVQLG